MDHPEKEPLLKEHEKDYYTLEIKDKKVENIQKSENQIKIKKCPDDFIEFLFFCCINYDINKEQYEEYRKLQNECSVQYNKEDKNHEKLLQEFFNNVKELLPDEEEEQYEIVTDSNTNNDELKSKNNLISNLSKKVGFQTNDPRTDFRAGGLYSLEFMNFFITNYKVESKDIFKDNYFGFALVCISLSYKICLILYLTDTERNESALKSNNLKGCSRKEIKNFYDHLEENNNLLFLILCQCLCFVFVKYNNDYEEDKKDENYFKINSIINKSIYYFKETLNNIKRNENLINKLNSRFEEAKNEKIDYKKEIKVI